MSEQTNGQFPFREFSSPHCFLMLHGLQQSWSFTIPPALGPLPGAQGMSQIFLPCVCGDLSDPMVRVTASIAC